MKRILWMMMTLSLALSGWSLEPKIVTIPGDAWTAYEIPEQGAELFLYIDRANTNLVIVDSNVQSEEENDDRMWYRSSEQPDRHIYRTVVKGTTQGGAVYSSREYLHVFGHYRYLMGGGGGGGTPPPFNARVAAPDVDMGSLTEEQEESLGVWIAKGGTRKAVTVTAVQCRSPSSSQQTLTWTSDKLSVWTASTGGSQLPGYSKALSASTNYTYYAQGDDASGSIRDAWIETAYTVSGQGTAQDKVKLTVVGAEIGAFDTILLNATNDVSVTLLPSPPGITSVLQIVCLSSNGSAVFVPSGSTTSNITNSATVKIKGVTASSVLSNMVFRAMLGSDVLASNVFTVVGMQEPFQYRIGTNSWANMPDPLYVCKDATVDFKAMKSPTNAPWPSGKPVWGGVLSGSGMESNSYTFSTVSTNDTDYKLVTAECGNTVTGKVLVLSVDLDIEGVDDTNEVTVGKVVVRNYDTNNAPRAKIILQQVEPTSWTGTVVLTRSTTKLLVYDAETNGTEITFNGTDNKFSNSYLPANLWVQGHVPSDSMRDVSLELYPEVAANCADAVKFTVLWVDITNRTTGNVSSDNAGKDAYIDTTGSDGFGFRIYSLSGALGVEFVGTVHPTGFDQNIVFGRDFLESKEYSNTELRSSSSTRTNDTSPAEYRDDDPQSGGSSGKIYDLDAPGVLLLAENEGDKDTRRANYEEWCTFAVGSENIRCSLIRPWFLRINVEMQADETFELCDDIEGDNKIGFGTTSLEYNLE